MKITATEPQSDPQTAPPDPHRYLRRSKADGGEKVGKLPSEISRSDLLALTGGPPSLPKIIRAKCLDCCGYEPGEVRKCVSFTCPLWPFRMGMNPLHGHATQLGE